MAVTRVTMMIDLTHETISDVVHKFRHALETATTPEHTNVYMDEGMRQDMTRIYTVLEMMADFAEKRDL
jgi:hypothetical protein